MLEVELLAAGLLRAPARRRRAARRCVSPTPASRCWHRRCSRNRAARDAHEALVERVAREMQRAGRIVWRGLSLRARVGEGDAAAWAMAMPDVFSIRHTTVEAYLEPVVHEVKVSRADLLSDLRHAAKRQAYLQLSSECWYVIRQGIARPRGDPAGVRRAGGDGRRLRRGAAGAEARDGAALRRVDGAGPGHARGQWPGRRRAVPGSATLVRPPPEAPAP